MILLAVGAIRTAIAALRALRALEGRLSESPLDGALVGVTDWPQASGVNAPKGGA